MKKSTRIFALLLTVCTLLASLPASAHSFTDVDEYDGAITALTELGVIRGVTSTTFSPNQNVTRWQMALLITKLSTGNTDDDHWHDSGTDIPFTDVKSQHYAGSIAYASENGIIIGVSATSFSPERGITLRDAYTMACRVLGYKGSEMDSGYPSTYIKKAESLGLSMGLSGVAYTDTLTRAQTAQLLFNLFRCDDSEGRELSDLSFGYTTRRMTLAATEQRRLYSSCSYAHTGRLVLCELNSDGTPAGSFYSYDASAFGMGSMTNSTLNGLIGKSWDVIAARDMSGIICAVECASTVYTDGLSASSSAISIDGVSYKPVSSYSYELTDGLSPSPKQIIIYGFGGSFKQGQQLSASDISSTCAFFTLRAYDDNGDGYTDRAVYIPYSFGLYSSSGSSAVINGEQKLSFSLQKVAMTGKTPSTGSYILYSYDADAMELDVLRVFELRSGYISAYSGSRVTITSDAASTGVAYDLGCASLPGAYPADVKSAFPSAASYLNAYVNYIADDETADIFMLDIVSLAGSASFVQGDGYVSTALCAVTVSDPDTSALVLNRVGLTVADSTGARFDIQVGYINGSAVNSVNAQLISAGDILEYEYVGRLEIVDGYPSDIYSVKTITSMPYVSLSQSTAYTYYMGCNGYYFGVGHKASSTGRISYDGQIRVGSYTRVLFYDGGTVADITASALKTGYEKVIPSGYCMYVSVGESGGANLIYIREKGDVITAVDADSFTTIAYLSSLSIKYSNLTYDNGVYGYPYATDMLTGKSGVAYGGVDISDGSFIYKYGCFKATVGSDGSLRLLDGEPLEKSVSNSTATFIYQGTITSAVKGSDGNYSFTVNGVEYRSKNVRIYELNEARELLAYQHTATFTGGAYLDERNWCRADIAMDTPGVSGVSDCITIVIYII